MTLRFQKTCVLFSSTSSLTVLFSVQLAGTNRPVALAQANAVLNRLDLICEVWFLTLRFAYHHLWLIETPAHNKADHWSLSVFYLLVAYSWTQHPILSGQIISNNLLWGWLQTVGASVFGLLLSKYHPVTCLKIACGLMICSFPVLVNHIYLCSLTWIAKCSELTCCYFNFPISGYVGSTN
jgi:hypothetical protein